ncbi:MAG: flagellar basal body L-ring protein FlgH [Hylemonella sp.]|nr:flagellar basal body L-ring protein FlgH [Hylemonella sp.]MDH5707629.1 flagellar basal body L-ring protein FlgH [Hylemonella sp.]
MRWLARLLQHRHLAAAPAAVLLLGACGSMPQQARVDFPDPKPVGQAPLAATPAPVSGSLFHSASYRPAFEDPRARAVGDTVTVRIVENVSASQKSSSTANRTSSIEGGITALPGLTFPPDTQDKITIGAGTSGDFSGKGGTESAHTFSGTITTTVTEVLPNGHLAITGEKQIGVNQNVDVLRFSGTVDPRVILPGSLVNSNLVANVRVQSRGRGAQDDAQTVGWLTRFFFSFSPF